MSRQGAEASPVPLAHMARRAPVDQCALHHDSSHHRQSSFAFRPDARQASKVRLDFCHLNRGYMDAVRGYTHGYQRLGHLRTRCRSWDIRRLSIKRHERYVFCSAQHVKGHRFGLQSCKSRISVSSRIIANPGAKQNPELVPFDRGYSENFPYEPCGE